MPDNDDVSSLADGTDEQADQGMRDPSAGAEHADDEIDSLIDKSTDATDKVNDS